MCELIRELHKLSLEAAQDLVDAIATRQVPEVHEVFGVKRVLSTDLSKKQEALLLLYSDSNASVLSEDLCKWVEHSTMANFRRDVLLPLHKLRQIEYDHDEEIVAISPTGIQEVESTILTKVRSKH